MFVQTGGADAFGCLAAALMLVWTLFLVTGPCFYLSVITPARFFMCPSVTVQAVGGQHDGTRSEGSASAEEVEALLPEVVGWGTTASDGADAFTTATCEVTWRPWPLVSGYRKRLMCSFRPGAI